MSPTVTVLTTGLAALPPLLAPIADDAPVVVVPPRTPPISPDRLPELAVAATEGVVVAAAPDAAVHDDLAAAHPLVDGPYRYLAPALTGTAGALRALPVHDITALTRVWLDGADLTVDTSAATFLVRDGTGTDAVDVGGVVVATATGSHPAVVIGEPVAAADRRDLARVLAYEDALALTGDGPVGVAPEIVSLPFWTPAMCTSVIRAAEAAAAWGSDPDDPVPGLEVSLATIAPRLLDHVEHHFGEVVVPRLRSVWPEIAWAGLHDAFVIKYAATPAAPSLALHHDVAQLSASVRLNAGYAGGALTFPRQDYDNGNLAVGDMIVWPSLVTHPHRGEPVTRGVKYGLTIWTRLPT